MEPYPDLVVSHEGLSRRKSIYRKYALRGNLLMLIGTLVLLFIIIMGMKLTDYLALGTDIGMFVFLAFLMLGMVVFSCFGKIGNRIYFKKASAYQLTSEEKLFLKIYPILLDLDTYLNEGLEDLRITIVDSLVKILRHIDERWDWGNLELTRKEVGDHVDAIRKNLREKLLPSVRKGDTSAVTICLKALTEFARYLINPTTDSLKQLNSLMIEMPKVEEFKEVTFYSRIPDIIKTRPILQHSIVGVLCFASGVVAFLFGVHFLHVSTDNAYIAGITLGGILFTAYVTFWRKKM